MNFRTILLIPFLFFTVSAVSQQTRPVYKMEVRLLPKEKQIHCNGSITLPPLARNLKSITLILSEVMHDFKISNNDLKMYPIDTLNGAVRWQVEGHNEFKAGTKPVLIFSYWGGDKTSFVFNISEEACFAGGNNTEWFPQVEKDARGIGMIGFTVPAGYVVFTAGKQLSKSEENQKGHYQFKINHPSYFSFAAAKYFIYKNVHQNTGASQTAFLLKQRKNIGAVLDSCVLVNNILQNEFGTNPYGKSSTLVEIPTELANNTQFEGASGEGSIWATSAFLDKPFNLAYYGHELSHHWWGNALGRNWWDSKNGRLMMDEAMAQYGSHKVVEVLEGREQAKQYRLYGYPGYIDFHSASGYFMLNAGGFDQPLTSLKSNDKSRILADSKGFIVYKMLSDYVGNDKFSKTLIAIQKKDAFTALTWEEFLKALEVYSKKDLNPFYQQWLSYTGAPTYIISWKQMENQIQGEVTQDSTNYQVLLPIRGVAIDGTIYNWIVQTKDRRTSFSFPLSKPINEILIDPDYQTLHWTREFIAMHNAYKAYIQAFDVAQNGNFKDAKVILAKALVEEPSNEVYGSRFLLNMALGQVALFGGNPAEAKSYLQKAVLLKKNTSYLLPWAYYYLARAGKETGDIDLMKYAIQKAIESESIIGKYIGAARMANDLQ